MSSIKTVKANLKNVKINSVYSKAPEVPGIKTVHNAIMSK